VSKHLYDIDEIFRSAYQRFREEPTAEVWKKINATLDKRDAESLKRRALNWRKGSLLLLLLVASLVLYETMTIKKDSGTPNKNPGAITGISTNNRKDASSEVKDPIIIGSRKINYVGNEQATNKRNDELTKDPEKYPTLFTQQTTPIFLADKEKTGYLFIKEMPGASSLSLNNSIQLKNNSTVQPGHKNSMTWTYTPFVSYEWAQYRIDSDLPAVNAIKQGTEHELSFSTGVLLTAQFTNKWMLQSGIVYSNTTIDIAPQKIYAVQSPGGDYAYKYFTSAGYGYIRPGFGTSPALGDSLSTAEAEHTLRHLTVPVVIKYKVKQGKFSIIPGAGIAANLLTGTKVETEIKNATDKETVIITKLTGTRTLNWSLVADAEMQYQLNNKMSLNVRPAFRYAISSITRNDDFQTFPYAFGIGAGLTFKF
jgi:outer membrane protein with beta-barrel domain